MREILMCMSCRTILPDSTHVKKFRYCYECGSSNVENVVNIKCVKCWKQVIEVDSGQITEEFKKSFICRGCL